MPFTVAVGDIHGMADKLRRLLFQIDNWLASVKMTRPVQFIYLGDYIDRGPDSKGVIETVRAMQNAGAICLRGNHEQLMIDSTESRIGEQNFLLNGGNETRASLRSDAAFTEAQNWMKTLPTFYEDELRYYVHAGLRPRLPLDQQDDYTRLWIRDEFLRSTWRFPIYVVHGHTPTISTNPEQTTPDIRDNRCNVDTGAGWGRTLSAAIFDNCQARPVHTISTM
jgi:serine/threonine protein phosphatase 1